MRDVWHDLRYAVRMLVKRRWYTVAAMTALALGIGANTAVFTLVNVVLLQGLPFDRSDRIVALGMQDPRPRNFGVSSQDFGRLAAWHAHHPGFVGRLRREPGVQRRRSRTGAVRRRVHECERFRADRQQAVIGRLFSAEDDRGGAPAVVVLGNDIWKNRYGSDRSRAREKKSACRRSTSRSSVSCRGT
jgi:hypothetical protein